MNKLIPILLAGALGGCAFNPFAAVVNPVSSTNLYQSEIVFDGLVKSFNELKSLCASRVLPPACRTYVIKGQDLIRNAYAADAAARTFVTNNPTLDATNAIQAFNGVVSTFKSTLDSLSATKQ